MRSAIVLISFHIFFIALPSSTKFSLTVMIRVMMFSATFNNISAISWRSVLLVDETGENHRPVIASHRQTDKWCIKYTSPERDSNSQR